MNIQGQPTPTLYVQPPVVAPPPPPRIKKISLSGYRAFPPYKPASLEINLGDTGKNLLLYGENGSGKTSLFRALRDLFDTSPDPRDYATVRNIFQTAEDDAIAVELTTGTPSEYRWEVGEPHPKTSGDSFHAFARTCLFLEYRDLLQTNFVHRSGPPNLFPLLVDSVLLELPVPTQPLKGLREAMRTGLPRGRQTRNPVARANKCAAALVRALVDHLPELVREVNRLLTLLQPLTKIQLNPPEKITYRKANAVSARGYSGEALSLEVELCGRPVAEPQYFLNEARLTAIALAVYLAAARLTRIGRPGIMVLDDVLIGLDLSNRIPLLHLLQTEFRDWQILLLTHDPVWFEIAREYTDSHGTWTNASLHAEEIGPGEPHIPRLKSPRDDLDVAKRHLHAGDLRAAAVYIRAALEARLRALAESCDIRIAFKRDQKKISADHLWQGLLRRHVEWRKAGKGHFIDPALISSISAVRSNVLNRLSHSGPTALTTPDVTSALQAVKNLRDAVIVK